MYRQLRAAGEIEVLGATSEESTWLGAPLLADGRLLGIIVVQSYSSAHTYTPADLDRLAFVGQHVASALSRARAIEETRQRNAELAVINEIGDALARQLDFQAIVELVGERIRTLFDSRSLLISMYDESTGLIDFPYEIDDGHPLSQRTNRVRFGPDIPDHPHQAPLRLGSNDEAIAMGAILPDAAPREQIPSASGTGPEAPGSHGGRISESWLGVPILIGDRVIGVISLESFEKDAYDEATERLLGTIATSMASALENARLFDETKRLLAEADARNVELAVINEIGEALARQLDFQASVEMVGERLRAKFHAQSISIGLLDRSGQNLEWAYEIEEGERIRSGPTAADVGLSSIVLHERVPVITGTDRREPGPGSDLPRGCPP